MATTHRLKTLPAYFDAIQRGDKTFEVRKNDRGFQAGDTLVLEYHDPTRPGIPMPPEPPPARLERLVTYVLPGGRWGLDPEYCVLGIQEAPAVAGYASLSPGLAAITAELVIWREIHNLFALERPPLTPPVLRDKVVAIVQRAMDARKGDA